ncbi:uncharacterized protein A4U43_C01F15550 [Asparagus officinalis]|uniref:AT-hook motif nuclear-localized protein n=1 Tax=Asparagus officinalis TaxID=4686 RepID=A0A5P1FU85_ASPOF|nr:AT-hook motif nuclear-localized protein 10-like [Asparagus officinalis]ONK80250.1 uncharacterized protein A4U43_C01F15550 [Asparagus officinalis]
MDAREPSRMSSSESPSMIVSPSSYPNSSMVIPNSGGMMPGMRISFSQMVSSGSKQMDGSSSLYQGDSVPSVRQCGVVSMGGPMKKKRGRPRKYGPDWNMALALCPVSSSSGYSNLNGSLMSNPNSSSMSELGVKKRGRPLGSGKKQQLDALGSAGICFTPHVLTVKAGEDIASKIMAFSQQGPQTVCILSANGAICNVTLRQPATSGGTVTYEGRFEIISLSGSFLLTETGGTRSRTGGLSVALAGSDGRVLGGVVAGMLLAATPVQVVMGSFIAEGKKPKAELKLDPSSVPPPQMSGFRSASGPPSQEGSLSESDDDDDPGSPAMNLSSSVGNFNNSGQHGQMMAGYGSIGGWTHSGHPSAQA